jgi:hypothetical protein
MLLTGDIGDTFVQTAMSNEQLTMTIDDRTIIKAKDRKKQKVAAVQIIRDRSDSYLIYI